jgi:nucleotide-binding universal stress UspA family protein
MRIVIAVDWSDQAFNAVQTATQLYLPQEIILVHAIDLRPFESPVFAPAVSKEAYKEFRDVMLKTGHQLLEQAATLVPADVPIVKKVCELGSPAVAVLETAKTMGADLVVTGARGRGRAAELFLGSVSHRILTHGNCSTLIVKRPIDRLRRVLVAVEASEDSIVLRQWLKTHPFRQPVAVSLISVIPIPQPGDPVTIPAFVQWQEATYQAAQYAIKAAAAELRGPQYEATGEVFKGDPAEVIVRESASSDLVVVGSHGRKGLEGFLLGSVSHAISHRIHCPVLVVR